MSGSPGWLRRLLPGGGSRKRLHIAQDVGHGPVVVLVHGIASSSVTFENLVPLLSERYRVITIDLLGFGGSPRPEGAVYTIDEHIEWLSQTLRSLRLRRPFILVGHSMGALLAARFAARHPRRLRSLVLVGIPVYMPPEMIADPVERATQNAYLKVYEYVRSNKPFTLRNASVLARIAPIKNVFEITEDNWVPFVESLRNCIETQTTIADIAAIQVPIRVLYGVFDPFIVSTGIKVIEQMRHVEVTRVEANDHLIRPRLARAVARAIDDSAEHH